MKVYVSTTKEAAAVGGALLAKFARWKETHGGGFEDMTGGSVAGMKCVAEPSPENVKVYEALLETYNACEQQVIEKGEGVFD
jgi:xylulokinase